MKINRTSNRKSETGRPKARGWSSLEVLLFLVIAYFAVSTGIGWVKDLKAQQLTDGKLREIAQRVITVTENAKWAGVDLIVDGDVEATVDRVARGTVVEFGEYRGQFFGMPDLKGKAKDRVTRHLEFQYDRLTVTPFESFASAD